MRFRHLFLLMFSVMLVLNAASLAASDDNRIDMQYRLTEGEIYAIRYVVDTKITQTVQDRPVCRSSHLNLKFDFQMLSVDEENNMLLSVTCHSIQAEYKSPFYHLSYDSSGPSEKVPRCFKPHQNLLEQEQTATLKPTGLASVDFIEPEEDVNIDTDDPEEMMAILSEGLNKIKVQPILSGVFPNYSSDSNAPDKEWSTVIQISDGEMVFSGPITYQPRKKADDSAVFDVEAELSCKFNSSQNANGIGCESNLALSGKLKGFIEVNPQNGWPISGEYTIAMSGMLHRMGQDIPVTLEMKIHFLPETIDDADDAAGTDEEQGGTAQ